MRFGASVGFAFGALALAPFPLESQAAEHGCFAGAGGGAADGAGGFRRVPQIGEHVHAALFDGRGLRVFILVDHVLVGGLVHELLNFRFDPGGAEGGEILLRVAVEDELIVDGLVDGLRVLLAIGELVGLALALWTSDSIWLVGAALSSSVLCRGMVPPACLEFEV